MAYTKKTWADGEVISKEALNNMETGIENATNGNPSNATKSKAGVVKLASLVSDVSAENAGTISEAFDQAEVQKVATLADANKTAINAIIASIIITFTLVNQTQSSPLLVKTALEINGITNQIPYMLLYFFMYLITSLILVGVLNIIIKELVIENTIGTYNRLIAGIIMLIAAFILIYFPGIFMMA